MIKLYHNYKLGRLELELGLMEEKIVKSDEDEGEDEIMTIVKEWTIYLEEKV